MKKRLPTPNELPDIRKLSGFSLIELVVVIALFTITTIAVTTSYVSFQGRETLKAAALTLKSDLRQVQNSAQSGDKASNESTYGCVSTTGTTPNIVIDSHILGGWYLSVADGGSSYTITGICLNTPSYGEATFGSKTVNLPTGVTVSAITCTQCGVGTTFAASDVLVVFFKSLASDVSFFKNPTITPAPALFDSSGVLTASYMTGNGETVITLNSTDGSYKIHISQVGEIHEEKI
jgi:prepilin-type N-terminal cleavage/methylation domain-containing protein